MAECWECKNENTQKCERCRNGYLDYIDGWVEFDEPTEFEAKESENDRS